MPTPLIISHLYRGPAGSASGGYMAGLLAGRLGATGLGGVEVTLRLPPPLDTELAVVEEDGRVLLLDGERLLAEARPANPGVVPPAPPSHAEATAAAREVGGWGGAKFDECFVCGNRVDGSGLGIYVGRVEHRTDELVAAEWIARDARPEIVWAAIDCPGAYALRGVERGNPLLARITARIERLPREGERCIVAGWPLDEDGRKRNAATALYGEDGEPIAVSRQLWIEPRGTQEVGTQETG
jgi:hypothetical protein